MGGLSGRCTSDAMLVSIDENEKHGVRCCSDTEINEEEWNMNESCNVWGGSYVGSEFGCYVDVTFASASGYCADAGARLCTKAELENDCAARTGCGLNRKLVWSKTSDMQLGSSNPPRTSRTSSSVFD